MVNHDTKQNFDSGMRVSPYLKTYLLRGKRFNEVGYGNKRDILTKARRAQRFLSQVRL